jgi:hypothetical protein
MSLERCRDWGDEPTATAPAKEVVEWCANDDDKLLFAIRICPVFVSFPNETGGQQLALSAIAKQIFERCLDKIAVFDEICKRLLPGSWSGSLAEIIRQRLVLLAELKPNRDEDLGQHINEMKQKVASYADEEEKRAESSDWEFNERFE